MQVKAIRIHETGGPEVMRFETVDLADPGPGMVRVRHGAIGINFIDTYHRTGLYPLPLPAGIGLEAAGTVEAVAPDVTSLKAGDRVAYSGWPGAYSEANNVPASRLVKLPDGVSEEDAAALMLKGMTVQYLFRQTYPLDAGQTILFHAAAGGVGLIACQWAKALGVTMIGTAGSAEKMQLALDHGCDHVINYRTDDVVAKVTDLTGGEMVPVVYDGVGKDTFVMSLDCLCPRGLLVSFGNASGPVTGVDLGILSAKGSLYVTRPTLATYTATTEQLQDCADDLFAVIESGAVTADVNQRFGLAEAAEAHRALEARETVGATLLIP